MSDLIDNGWLSVCHDAPVRVVGGDEGTNHWECTKCGQSCNATKQGSDMAYTDFEPSVGYSNPQQGYRKSRMNKLTYATKLDKKLIRKLCMDWLPALKSLAKK